MSDKEGFQRHFLLWFIADEQMLFILVCYDFTANKLNQMLLGLICNLYNLCFAVSWVCLIRNDIMCVMLGDNRNIKAIICLLVSPVW